MDYDYHADIAARRAKVLAKMEEQNRIRKLKEQEEAMQRAKEQEENDRKARKQEQGDRKAREQEESMRRAKEQKSIRKANEQEEVIQKAKAQEKRIQQRYTPGNSASPVPSSASTLNPKMKRLSLEVVASPESRKRDRSTSRERRKVRRHKHILLSSPEPDTPSPELQPTSTMSAKQIKLSEPIKPSIPLRPGKKPRLDGNERRTSARASAKASPNAQSPPPVDGQPPEWYTKIGDWPEIALVKRRSANVLTALSRFKDAIKECEKPPRYSEPAPLFQALREQLHNLEFLTVDKFILRAARLLDNRTGLPKIFNPKYSEGVVYPWDIRADAEQLHSRWVMQVFDTDLLRGIVQARQKGKQDKRNADSIDRNFPGRQFANFYGQGHLVNGQWWPTQLCTVRDGAHGAAQGGIYGEAGKGVYSIVLSGGNHYSDVDSGDTIWYSGTDSKDETPTENTRRMLETLETPPPLRQPVRVIRSWNLRKENPYRPQRGFRYDGLYDVQRSKVLDGSKAIHAFYLVRRDRQDPIRYQGAEVRPTAQEIREYDKLRLLERSTGSEIS